jgi:hypothetical protein
MARIKEVIWDEFRRSLPKKYPTKLEANNIDIKLKPKPIDYDIAFI